MATVVLSNHKFPEDGQVSIPLPIPPEEYEHCMEMLEVLCIGHATRRDCMVDSIDSDYPALERLEGEMINLDELDYANLSAFFRYLKITPKAGKSIKLFSAF